MFAAIRAIILSLVVLTAVMLPVSAGTYQFIPGDADLGDLDHGYYYSWGINWTLPATEEIVDATLFIDNIDDWTREYNDHLYIHLLDNPQLGVKQFYDGEGGGDNWAGNPFIANYTDPNTWNEDLTYRFSTLGLVSMLNSYVTNDSRFGLGFDPDCHYYNCGVKLTITTETKQIPPVPEPSGIVAVGMGLTSLAGLLRRRSA